VPVDGDLVIGEADLSIRLMRADDASYRQLLAWRLEPHVRAVWDTDDAQDELSLEGIRGHYGPWADPSQATTGAFIELEDRPIGFIQFYPWAAYADEAREMDIPLDGEPWGLDVFIGDPELVGRGHGSRAVDLLCRYLFETRGATSVALLTDIENLRAQRAYEKAGFEKIAESLDLDTRDGVRVRSWLMIRPR
jgi:aminoglycoside 6'-N-acetyltransferase